MNRKRQVDRHDDKYEFWSTLRTIQEEFRKTKPDIGFTDWLVEKYGIEIDSVDGMYGASYTIIDEAKHTFYKLKYG